MRTREWVRLRALVRREDGVSAVIVSISLVAVFGAAMLSIDSGSVWRTRRALITDTDAAALAAARHIDANGASACSSAVAGGGSARDEAEYILKQNDADATLDGFTASAYGGNCSGEAGRVRVDGRLPISLAFASIFGFKDLTAFSSSTAQWGPLVTTTGLRPIAICDKSPHLQEWASHLEGNDAGWGAGPGHPGGDDAVVHRIYFQRGASGCGDASGNWDWLDFNETSNPNGASALREWLRNGYPGVISIGDDATGIPRDCNPERSGSQDACAPKTGAGANGVEDALEYLQSNGIVFPLIVYDRVVDERDPQGCDTPPPWTASGNNARFCPVAFLLVRVHGWDKITGQLSDNSYFDLEFLDQWTVGQIGVDPAEGRPTAHGVSLCGTNYGKTIDILCDV